MKRHIFLVALLTILLLVSCGQPKTQDDSELIEEQHEQDEMTLAYEIIEEVGGELSAKDPVFDKEYWEKMDNLVNEICGLINTTDQKTVDKEQCASVFAKYDFNSFEEGKKAVDELAELQEYLTFLTIQTGVIKISETTMQKEQAKELRKELQDSLNEREFTKEDVIMIVENKDIIGKAVAARFTIHRTEW